MKVAEASLDSHHLCLWWRRGGDGTSSPAASTSVSLRDLSPLRGAVRLSTLVEKVIHAP